MSEIAILGKVLVCGIQSIKRWQCPNEKDKLGPVQRCPTPATSESEPEQQAQRIYVSSATSEPYWFVGNLGIL
jgi:hypothetical protein